MQCYGIVYVIFLDMTTTYNMHITVSSLNFYVQALNYPNSCTFRLATLYSTRS